MAFLLEEGPGIDMDQLFDAWKETARMEKNMYLAEHMLESHQANLMSTALSSPGLWVNGKPPTASYLEKIVAVVGSTEEDKVALETLVNLFAAVKEEYIGAKGHLDVLHEKIRIWQTMSANSRKVLS